MPKGPPVTIRWDDDFSGATMTMKASPGLTAFFDTAQLYNLLTDEEKELVENGRWEPAPHPFAWTGTRKLRSCGFGTTAGGEVVPLDQLPEWTPEKVYQFPMVWVNPVTGEKGLHIHNDVVRKLYFRPVDDGPDTVIEDLEEIRTWLNSIVDRVCNPEYIAIPPYDEGDLLLFNNWGVVHSAIDYPVEYGSRLSKSPLELSDKEALKLILICLSSIVHQSHIASSVAPRGTMTAASVA